MQINNYCPIKMSFPCNIWTLLSSKHLENQMINGFLEKWQNDMSSLKEKVQEEIREEKGHLESFPLLHMIDSLFVPSEKISKEEYQLALNHIVASKQPSTGEPFTTQIGQLENLLKQTVSHFPLTSVQVSAILDALEKLKEIIYPHDSYKKVN